MKSGGGKVLDHRQEHGPAFAQQAVRRRLTVVRAPASPSDELENEDAFQGGSSRQWALTGGLICGNGGAARRRALAVLSANITAPPQARGPIIMTPAALRRRIGYNSTARIPTKFHPASYFATGMYRLAIPLLVVMLLPVVPRPVRCRAGEPQHAAGGTAAGRSPDVSFQRDIQPLLAGRCVRCHGRGQKKGGFQIDTRETILAGGDSGPAAIAGRADDSLLVELISGKDPDRVMPAQGSRLNQEEINRIRDWINAGLPWPEGFSFARPAIDQAIELRRVAVPAAQGSGLTNPIDLLLQSYFVEHPLASDSLVDDRTFARRVYLDVIGLLPTTDELAVFLADNSADKRARLVERLLADKRRYAEHWLSFWNDALRNDYQGTGYIDGGRKQITEWLYHALVDNMPYDQFVRELVNPSPPSEGFAKGIVWRGVVNASQVPAMQAAQNIGQIFLGTNLKCASCHDSFVNAWKLSDCYALAAVYAEGPLEMHKCDKPTGKFVEPAFLFSSLGKIDPKADRPTRLAQLAQLITSPKNGVLARTIVNRLWDRFFGRGLIEPVDTMENQPWHADLLEWLAGDLVEHGYDLKHAIARMLTSRAYQLPAVGAKAREEDFVFDGPLVRRMSAEQFVDCVSQLTSVWQDNPATAVGLVDLLRETSASATGPVRFASGILDRGAVSIDIDLTGAHRLWLVVSPGQQGTELDWASWCEPELTVAGKAVRLSDLEWKVATSGYQKPQINKNVVGGTLGVDGRDAAFGIGTHAFSLIIYDLPAETTHFRAVAGPDNGATHAASGHEMEFFVLTDVPVRAALAPADTLTKALGRPNREQVVTRRSTIATTLEALELNNGATLDRMLNEGARRWLARRDWQSPELVDCVYEAALARQANPAERDVACELLGNRPSVEGLADLLWTVVMLPEFQLIQ
jgi:mono/diheme cytochrome c family protein